MDILKLAMIISAILITSSLASTIADKVGDISFWVNGTMIIGALTYTTFGSLIKDNPSLSMFVALLMAMVMGALFTMIHILATVKFKADFILSATTLNIIAPAIAMTLTPILSKKLQGQSTFQNPIVDIGLGKSGMTTQTILFFVIAVIIALMTFFYFSFTKVGKRHRAIGEAPNASDAAGINVIKYKWIVLSVAGAIAGLSGAMVVSRLGVFSGNVQGLGFIALAIVILGQWRSPIILVVGVVFSTLWAFIDFNSSLGGIPKPILKMMPFILALISMAFLNKFSHAPKSQGVHFNKSKR